HGPGEGGTGSPGSEYPDNWFRHERRRYCAPRPSATSLTTAGVRSRRPLRVVVGPAGGDLLGAVDLFSQDEADQLVREDQLGEAPHKVRAPAQLGTDPIGSTDDDDDPASGVELRLNFGGQLGRGDVGAPLIEQDHEVGRADAAQQSGRLFAAGEVVLV